MSVSKDLCCIDMHPCLHLFSRQGLRGNTRYMLRYVLHLLRVVVATRYCVCVRVGYRNSCSYTQP